MSDIANLYTNITNKFNTLDENDKSFKIKSILINNSMDEIIVSINTIKKMLKDANTIRTQINDTGDQDKEQLIISFIDKLREINARVDKLIANSKKELLNPDKFKKLSAHLKEIIENPNIDSIKDFDLKYFTNMLTQTSDEKADQDRREAAEVSSGGTKNKSRIFKGGYLYGQSIKRYSKKYSKKSKKRSKKLKGGYLYRKRNKYQKLSSTRKSKRSSRKHY